mmetsp:Transcript_88715/g.228809  ORF Transcript_88715/g.228809 Transcript_88715/m.228809 type:complete len:253 (-) Transcript_88715:384-1142(-)
MQGRVQSALQLLLVRRLEEAAQEGAPRAVLRHQRRQRGRAERRLARVVLGELLHRRVDPDVVLLRGRRELGRRAPRPLADDDREDGPLAGLQAAQPHRGADHQRQKGADRGADRDDVNLVAEGDVTMQRECDGEDHVGRQRRDPADAHRQVGKGDYTVERQRQHDVVEPRPILAPLRERERHDCVRRHHKVLARVEREVPARQAHDQGHCQEEACAHEAHGHLLGVPGLRERERHHDGRQQRAPAGAEQHVV